MPHGKKAVSGILFRQIAALLSLAKYHFQHLIQFTTLATMCFNFVKNNQGILTGITSNAVTDY
jgi:hypothetical protein